MHGPVDYIPPNVYDLIDEEMIYNSASKTKGSAGPSGMDSELYRRILCSKNFKTEGKILREEIAVFTTGGPSSSCEMIILRNNSHGGIIRVCMGIFTTALRNKQNTSNSQKKYLTLLPQCIICYLTAYFDEKSPF